MIVARADANPRVDTVEARALPLIRALYSTVVKDSEWQDFAVALSEAFGGAAIVLWLPMPWPVPDHLSVEVFREGRILRDIPVEETPEQAAWNYAHIPWSITGRQCRNRFGWSRDLFPNADVTEMPFFEETMQPQGLASERPIAALIPDVAGERALGVVAFRREAGRAFTAEDLRLGDLLVPHLRRAFDLDVSIDRAALRTRAMAEIVDRMPNGTLLVDRVGRPVATNREADRILSLEDGLRLESDGLHAATVRDEGALRSAIAEATKLDSPSAPGRGGILGISRPSGRRDFAVIIIPLIADPNVSGNECGAAALFITDPETGQSSTVDVLRSIFSLTPAEGQLTKLIADGRSLEEIAEIRGVTIATIRSQLKEVFSKTGTKRQSELVRLVLHGVGSMDVTTDGGAKPRSEDS